MKILGLDSSGLVAGVAVVEDGILRAEYTTNYKKTHSQTLLPMLDEVKRMIELDLDTLDAIAVASGPGSFTGLRIGSATAKGLGLALDKPIVEVPTLEGMAYNLWGTDCLVCPMLDARRGQVYTGVYTFVTEENFESREQSPRLETVQPQAALDVTELLGKLTALSAERGKPVIFLGDGVQAYRNLIAEKATFPYRFALAPQAHQRAASVAALGGVYFEAGRHVVTAAEHRPDYLRKEHYKKVNE